MAKKKAVRRVSVMRGERKEKSRERNFSLRSMEIGPWVFVEVKGKVDPRIASYVWVPKY